MKPKYIQDWEELQHETSPTHKLEIDPEYGSGWVRPLEGEEKLGVNTHYLSTHTFYGMNHEYSTKILQDCGFNVILANWDAE